MPQDAVKAAQAFEKSAKGGNANGMYNYGRCFFHGLGVPQDLLQAREWITKAAQAGHKNAAAFMEDQGWN